MTTGQRIKDLRKECGYSRVALAEKLNMPHTTLRNYENGDREPGHSFLIAIANEFNVSVDYLLGLGPKEEKNKTPTADDAAEALYELLYFYLGHPPSPEQIKAFQLLIPTIIKGVASAGE